MPTYEYACRDCGRNIEVVQSFTDDPLETCERCGGRLRKVFSAAGIIFKGSGYYVTDTRSERSRSSVASRAGPADGGSDDGSGDGSSGAKGDGSSTSSDPAPSSSTGSSSSDAKSA